MSKLNYQTPSHDCAFFSKTETFAFSDLATFSFLNIRSYHAEKQNINPLKETVSVDQRDVEELDGAGIYL